MRRERLVALLRQWGPWAIGALVLVLAGIVGWQQITAYQTAQRAKFSDALIAAQTIVQQGDPTKAQAQLDAIQRSAPQGYASIVQLERAGVFVAKQQSKEAIAAFDTAAAGAKAKELAALAQLRAAYLAADQGNAVDFKRRVQALIDAGGSFGLLARELAGMQAFSEGEFAAAREQFEFIQLGGLDAPPGLRQRAGLMLSLLGPEVKTGTAAAPGAPTPPAASGTAGGAAPEPASPTAATQGSKP